MVSKYRGDLAFGFVLMGALVVRILAVAGYRPGIWFLGDSLTYLGMARHLNLRPERPNGYPVFLRALQPLHSLSAVVMAQQLMVLAVAVMVYLLLRRRTRLPGWAAALLVSPVLLDGYLLQLGQLLMSDTLFMFLTMAAITLLLWRDRPPVWHAVAAGLLMSLATLTRSAGLPLLILICGWLLLRRTGGVGRRGLAAVAVVAALPLLGYASAYRSEYGRFTLNGGSGILLWARTMTFADCAKIKPPPEERPLCPPPGARWPAELYIWKRASPLAGLPGHKFAANKESLGYDFAKRAILAQPADYLTTVLRGIATSFRWNPADDVTGRFQQRYLFRRQGPAVPDRMYNTRTTAWQDIGWFTGRPYRTIEVVEPEAGWIRGYQRHVFLPGPVLVVILLAGAAGVAAAWRRRGEPVVLPWAAAMVLIVVPPAVSDFDYRYVLPAFPLACLAFGLALPELARPGLRRSG